MTLSCPPTARESSGRVSAMLQSATLQRRSAPYVHVTHLISLPFLRWRRYSPRLLVLGAAVGVAALAPIYMKRRAARSQHGKQA